MRHNHEVGTGVARGIGARGGRLGDVECKAKVLRGSKLKELSSRRSRVRGMHLRGG